jgi:dolichyl-phosphate beta-glucosyltransferase
MKKIYLSVVIPCYNEERNIRLGALENLAHYMEKRSYLWEALIVDDGSRDASIRLIKEFITDHPQFRIIERKHQGKAAAVSAGVMESSGEYILFTDLDQATPINQLEKLLPKFDEGYDIIIGSRASDRRGAPFMRLMMARGFMMLRNLILNLGIRDTQCGFKIFKRPVARDLFPRLKVYHVDRQANGSTVTAGFDVELLYMAKLQKFTIAEVPVEWHYQETRHVSPLKDSLESLVDLMVIRLNSMKGVYNG